MAIHYDINPLVDQTGENCDVYQQGDVWNLAGTLGGNAERDCTIPAGKQILYPIINTFCSELTGEALIKDTFGIPKADPFLLHNLKKG